MELCSELKGAATAVPPATGCYASIMIGTRTAPLAYIGRTSLATTPSCPKGARGWARSASWQKLVVTCAYCRHRPHAVPACASGAKFCLHCSPSGQRLSCTTGVAEPCWTRYKVGALFDECMGLKLLSNAALLLLFLLQ